MATDVKVPPMGESITGGVLSAWKVQDGEIVEQDQVLFELETDKITAEGLAETAGQISLKVAEGDEVEIGQVVAVIDESAAAAKPATASKEAAKPEPDTPKEAPAEASPAVRRIAAETGIDPATVEGTGKGGRVTKGDILAASEKQKSKPEPSPAQPPARAPEPTPAAPKAPGERTTRKRLSPLRQRIGERLVAAQHEAAILTTFNEVDLSEVRKLRVRYQDRFIKKYGVKLGFMSFFIKAAVEALKDIPQLNAQLEGDTLVQNHFYDIGVAVSSERGLLVPVIRDCDQLTMAKLETELISYAQKARDGKIEIKDLEGGVFTISNGGIFGSLLSTPILNPPQAGILGMHTIQERPVAVDGEIVIRPMMYLALSYDHRIVDGREAVTFLVRIKEVLEDPTRFLLKI